MKKILIIVGIILGIFLVCWFSIFMIDKHQANNLKEPIFARLIQIGTRDKYIIYRLGYEIEVEKLDNEIISTKMYMFDKVVAGVDTITVDAILLPFDFNFSLTFGVGGKNSINTYEKTFTKDLVIDETETIEFNIPKNEMHKIYRYIKEHEIDKLSSELSLEGMSVIPSQQLNFTYTDNGEIKSIIWRDAFWEEERSLPNQNNQFLRFIDTIIEYIYNTDEYKSMSPANGEYL